MIELDYLIDLAFILPQPTIFTFPVGLALGAILGALIVNEIRYRRKIKEDQIKIYSQLRGKKHLIAQSYTSVATYAIFIENNRALKNFLKSSEFKDDPAVMEIIEKIDRDDPILRRLHDEKINNLAKVRERMWKDIGFVEILFKNPQLMGLMSTIENSEDAIERFIKNLEVEIANGQYEVSLSDSHPTMIDPLWQTKKERDLKNLDTALKHAIDNLLNEIKRLI